MYLPPVRYRVMIAQSIPWRFDIQCGMAIILHAMRVSSGNQDSNLVQGNWWTACPCPNQILFLVYIWREHSQRWHCVCETDIMARLFKISISPAISGLSSICYRGVGLPRDNQPFFPRSHENPFCLGLCTMSHESVVTLALLRGVNKSLFVFIFPLNEASLNH